MNCPSHQCPLCGGPNECQLAGAGLYQGPCWCFQVEADEQVLASVPLEQRHRACLCRNCLEKKSTSSSARDGSADFYFNKAGLMVFTAEYHLQRGHCCDSGCLHCPYD